MSEVFIVKTIKGFYMKIIKKVMLGVSGMLVMGVTSVDAAAYNPVMQQAQTQLLGLGFDPNGLDGIHGPNTAKAIKGYQNSKGLSGSGKLDSATLSSLGIGFSTDLVNNVSDWRAVPTQSEIDQMVGQLNRTSHPYADYRKNAGGLSLDLPGKAILEAMNKSADVYGSRLAGQPKHTAQGYKYMSECLKTGYAPTHWSDITIHYYCQVSKPRVCYTYALSGKSTNGVKYTRPKAFKGCVAGTLQSADDFKWVAKHQPLVFQYVMFGQTHAFNHEQEQAIINAFYGVKNPMDVRECSKKRPRRTEDPKNGTHCQVSKFMATRLVGKSR
jgi:hypothetical protein